MNKETVDNKQQTEDANDFQLLPLFQDEENEKLFTVLCNYLSLGQFELGRTVLDKLFDSVPERVVRLLRAIVLSHIPPEWLFSKSVPSRSHLSWLAYIEYKRFWSKIEKAVQEIRQDGAISSSQPEGVEEKQDSRRNSRSSEKSGGKRRKKKLGNEIIKSQLTPINPLGFLSHDTLCVTIMEAKHLNLATAKNGDKCYVVTKCEQASDLNKTDKKEISRVHPHPSWKHETWCKVEYADSRVTFDVHLYSEVKNSTTGVVERVEDKIIGTCSLPLHQMRHKEFYHIWIPLDVPVANQKVASSSKAPTQPGASVNYGKMRIKLQWHPSSTPEGRFPDRTIWLLETDMLLANAVSRSKDQTSHRLLSPDIVNEIRKYVRSSWRNHLPIKAQLEEARQLMIGDTATGNYLTNPVSQDEQKKDHSFDTVLSTIQWESISEEIDVTKEDTMFRQLRVLIREEPLIGHALCAKLAGCQRQDSLFQHFYSQIIGEMLVRGGKEEFVAACLALQNFCKYICPLTEPSSILEDTFRAFILYIYADNPKVVNQHLFALLSGRQKKGTKLYESKIEIESEFGRQMDTLSEMDILEAVELRAKRKLQVYSALLGSNNQYALKRYCFMEDRFLHGPKPISEDENNYPNELPVAFTELHKCLAALDQMEVSELAEKSQSGMAFDKAALQASYTEKRQFSLDNFWTNYSNYIRVTRQHIFEYPQKMAHHFIKNNNDYNQWTKVSQVLLPFPQLRPLVLLKAWDDLESDFFGRKQLIKAVWTDKPSDKYFKYFEPCSERRLIEWCDRLSLFMDIITIVLGIPNNIQQLSHEDKMHLDEKGSDLLALLHTKSILEALRQCNYLSSLYRYPDRYQRLIARIIEAQQDDDELRHDVDVLRCYFAVRHVLELVLNAKTFFRNNDKYDLLPGDMLTPPGEELWSAAKENIVQMFNAAYQITALESIFAMLFIRRKDVQTNEPQSDAKNFDDQQHFHLDSLQIRLLLEWLKDVANQHVRPHLLQPRVDRNGGDKQAIMDLVDTEDRSLIDRIHQLIGWIDEGITRREILASGDQVASMTNMVAPLSSLSTYFLKQGSLDKAKLTSVQEKKSTYPDHLSAQVQQSQWLVSEEQSWSELGEFLRSEKMLHSADLVINWFPKASSGQPGGSLRELLQNFFFCMDVAVSFPHHLSDQARNDLFAHAIQQARRIKQLKEEGQGTDIHSDSVNQRALHDDIDTSLLDFCTAYALHRVDGTGSDFFLHSKFSPLQGRTKMADAWTHAHYHMNKGVYSSVESFEHYTDYISKDPKNPGLKLLQYLAEDGPSKQKHQSDSSPGDSKVSEGDEEGLVRTLTDPDEVSIMANKILAPLTAVRHVLRDCEMKDFKAILNYVQKYTANSLTDMALFSRWLQWRVTNYDKVYRLYKNEIAHLDEASVARSHNGAKHLPLEKVQSLLSDMRRLFVNENCQDDHRAIQLLVEAYVEFFQSREAAKKQRKQEEKEFLRQYLEEKARLEQAGMASADFRMPPSSLPPSTESPEEQEKVVKLMLYVLDVIDSSLNFTVDAKAASLVESLLEILIPYLEDRPALQPQLILRLNDVVKASNLTLQYVHKWDDAEICCMVLFKCLCGLQNLPDEVVMEEDGYAASPLSTQIECKYHMVLIYKELLAKMGPEELRRTKLQPKVDSKEAGDSLGGFGLNVSDIGAEQPAEKVKPDFSTWQKMEDWCWRDLESVINRLIYWRQVEIAEKLFAVCRDHFASEHSVALSMMYDDQKKVHNRLASTIEAAHIAVLLCDDKSVQQRLHAIQRLDALPARRKFKVGKGVLYQLTSESVHQRSVIAEYLHNAYLQRDKSTRPPSKANVPGDVDCRAYLIYPTLREREAAWLHAVLHATRILVKLPGSFQNDPHCNILAQSLDKVVSWPASLILLLLHRGCLALVKRVFSVFGSYCDYMKWNPFDMILDFASGVLTLETQNNMAGVEKDVAMGCLQICLQYPYLTSKQRREVVAKVGLRCLDIANRLSWKLSRHHHPILVLNLIKSVLHYYAKNCRNVIPRMDKEFDSYFRLVCVPARDKEEPEPLLFALRGVDFCLKELVDPAQACILRNRLIYADQLALARRVWWQLEGRDPDSFEEALRVPPDQPEA